MPLLIAVAIAVLIAGGAYLLLGDGDGAKPPGERVEGGPTSGIGAEDPANDGEHDDEVANATDGDPESYWTTQDYGSFDKPGVGSSSTRVDRLRSSLTVLSDPLGLSRDDPGELEADRRLHAGVRQAGGGLANELASTRTGRRTGTTRCGSSYRTAAAPTSTR